MKVNGKEVVTLPLKFFWDTTLCPCDFPNSKIFEDIESHFGKIELGKCKSNIDCEKCWKNYIDKINELYGTTLPPDDTDENNEISRNSKKFQLNDSDREYALKVLEYETECLKDYKAAFKMVKSDNMKKTYEKCIKKKTLICEALTHYVLGR